MRSRRPRPEGSSSGLAGGQSPGAGTPPCPLAVWRRTCRSAPCRDGHGAVVILARSRCWRDRLARPHHVGDRTVNPHLRAVSSLVACSFLFAACQSGAKDAVAPHAGGPPSAPAPASAQPQAASIPASITTPDKADSRIGPLEFKDGIPSDATLTKVYDNLDFAHAFDAFVNTFQGV